MSKTNKTYTCQKCGVTYLRWMGKCESCGEWNSVVEGVKQINENIGQVSEAASVTGKDASNTQDAAKNLGSIATGLKAHVAKLNV